MAHDMTDAEMREKVYDEFRNAISKAYPRSTGITWTQKNSGNIIGALMRTCLRVGKGPDAAVRMLGEDAYGVLDLLEPEERTVRAFHVVDKVAVYDNVGRESERRLSSIMRYAVRRSLATGGRKGDVWLWMDPSDVRSAYRWLVTSLISLSSESHRDWALSWDEARDLIDSVLEGRATKAVQKSVVTTVAADGSVLWSIPTYASQERFVSGLLRDLVVDTGFRAEAVAELIEEFNQAATHRLDDDQVAAVQASMSCGLSVITGGPGRGKTAVCACLAYVHWRLSGRDPVPTAHPGKAALNLVGAMERSSSLHTPFADTGTMLSMFWRRDGYRDDDSEYGPAEGHGDEDDDDESFAGRLVIIDEASMVDLSVMAQFGRLLPGAHVVLVGDQNQLPSVDVGRVFADVIESGVCPVSTLTVNHRVKGRGLSGVADSVLACRRGQVPTDKVEGRSERMWWPAGDRVREDPSRGDEVIADSMVSEYVRLLDEPMLSPRKIALLSPFSGKTMEVDGVPVPHTLSTIALNKKIQNEVNPDGLSIPGRTYREGDRVVVTQNIRELGLMNGDAGTITQVNMQDNEVDSVYFSPDKAPVDKDIVAEVPASEMGKLDLGYALTVHKAQGSEYTTVILALPQEFRWGWSMGKNWLYTAMTRATQEVQLHGDIIAYNNTAVFVPSRRRTLLAEQLAQ